MDEDRPITEASNAAMGDEFPQESPQGSIAKEGFPNEMAESSEEVDNRPLETRLIDKVIPSLPDLFIFNILFVDFL